MEQVEQSGITEKNMDRLAQFLAGELIDPTVSHRIPDGAHLFHGSYNDLALTNANLDMASEILLGMILGYVEPAPLAMVFERSTGESAVIDLSDEAQRSRAQAFIELFRRDTQRSAVDRIGELLLAA